MFYLRELEVKEGELLFSEDFSSGWQERWEISGGEWNAAEGVLDGLYRGNAGGLIYTNAQFPGNIIMDFYGRMVSPCNNDLNFSFRAKGWDYEKGDAAQGYIAGINGWWKNRIGIEHYPECRIFALSGMFDAKSDRDYHIQAGIVDSYCFIAVDGTLAVLLADPDPISEEGCFRIGLGTYCSHVQFRDLKIFRAESREVPFSYAPQF
ncbi:MAG: hypothetical protein IJO94_03600 [Firmicutes bacterium]|nr:hypothetical protein [Bacillota bacterium]